MYGGGNGKGKEEFIPENSPTNIARPNIYFLPPILVDVAAPMTYCMACYAPTNIYRPKGYFAPPVSVVISATTTDLILCNALTNIAI